MKRILLFALVSLAIVSCKRTVITDSEQPKPNGDVIMLTSGGAAATMVANEGVRVDFEKGDLIALFAAYYKGESSAREEDWTATTASQDSIDQKGPYFQNWPALCFRPVSSEAPAVTIAGFSWGTLGEGTVEWNRIYPRNDRAIAVYAYYPYSAIAGVATVDPVKGPLVNVELIDLGTIDGSADSKQADILHAVGKPADNIVAPNDTVCRTQPLAPLHFQHALAQLNFTVQRGEKAAKCFFHELKFYVPKKGVMSVKDGKIEVKIETQGTPVAADSIVFHVTAKAGEEIPAEAAQPVEPLSILEGKHLLMVMPLIDTDTKNCRLELTVYYGDTYTDTDTPNLRKYYVNLNGDHMKGFNKGKKNTLKMSLSETIIFLEADIKPWEDNSDDENPEIPVE